MKPDSSIRPELSRIVLTGFMGSGKTTVGRILAGRLQWRFADLDDRVEARAGRSVPQIFVESGEAAFRVLEAEALSDLLLADQAVISLGGGAPGTAAVRELLQAAPNTAIVHLDAPFAVLYDRCAAQAMDPLSTERPLLGDLEAARERYDQRRPLYAALAHLRADAGVAAPDAVAQQILHALGFAAGSGI